MADSADTTAERLRCREILQKTLAAASSSLAIPKQHFMAAYQAIKAGTASADFKPQ